MTVFDDNGMDAMRRYAAHLAAKQIAKKTTQPTRYDEENQRLVSTAPDAFHTEINGGAPMLRAALP